MRKSILSFSLILLTSQANAFGIGGIATALGGDAAANATGTGSDAALLGELQIQTAKMVEELKTIRDTLDISKRMEDMQQLKVIKQVSAEGEALSGILYDVEEGQGIIDKSKGNAFNHNDIENQIAYLENRAERADNPQAYARMLADLKRIRFLGQANDASIKKISEGSNETDDIKTSAVNSAILAQIEANRAADAALRKNAEISALQDPTSDSNY